MPKLDIVNRIVLMLLCLKSLNCAKCFLYVTCEDSKLNPSTKYPSYIMYKLKEKAQDGTEIVDPEARYIEEKKKLNQRKCFWQLGMKFAQRA